ncbi:MAG: AAA family ATPase [Sandaracinaceae bacterium]
MLEEVSIRGFKSLADVTLELGRFNVVIGANGAGKTNLLEAIGLIGCAAYGAVDDEAFLRRGVRPGVPALFKSAFKGRDKIPRLIRLQATSPDGGLYRVALDNPIGEPQPAWRIANESVELHGEVIASRGPAGARLKLSHDTKRESVQLDSRSSIAQFVRARPDALPSGLLGDLADFAIYTPFTPMLRGTVPDSSARVPLGLSGGRLAEATRELSRGTAHEREGLEVALGLIDWARSIDVGTPAEAQLSPAVGTKRNVVRFRDRFMVDKRSWLSAFDASEGALYVLFLSILAAHGQSPRVVAIDNVDQGLNPRLARALISRTQEMILGDVSRPQMILTAHSPLVLDALRLRDPRVRLFVVQRARSGETQVRRLPWDEALEKAEEAGMTLSRLWLSGALGGMPEL